ATVAQTGAMQTILTLPFVLLAIPAGVLADRLRRKTLMAWAEGLRAGSLLLLVILIVAGQLNWITLTALGFISVCGTVMFSVAAPALVPALVASKYLVSANARIELARTSAFTVGPALGGFLVGGIGAGAAFGVATILSILAVRMLQGINEQVRPRQQHRRPVQEIKEGVAFIASHPLLAPIFLTQFIFSAGMFMILAVFVPHAVHGLGLSASSVGLVMAMLGGGLFFGAVLSGAVLSRISFGAAIGIGPFTGLAGSIFIAATAWVPSAPLAGLVAGFGFFLLGAGPILWVISTTTLRQSVTPAELLGRVSAINILTYGARPLGAGLGTVIGSQFGAEVSLMATVIIFALQAAVISISPAVRLSEQPSGPILTDGAHP
ncbi:MAG: MFS transporter, partial [Rhodospirillaceae bacterium]|nr:MFS transporter [Rhodospirillaceae bacterium]